MDPNANLEELLRLARESQALIDSDEGATPLELAERLDRMSELVLALDAWLRGGGFAPRVWSVRR